MVVTIFDRLSDNLPEIKQVLQKEERLFKQALENQYKLKTLSFVKITREEAIKVNLGDIETINKVYFQNISVFTNFARYYEYNKTYGTKIYNTEDILQQVYVDLRYYDFTNENTVKKCLNITCVSSNMGGILNYLHYRTERKPTKFLYEQISAHNSKMEESALLLDYIQADEKETNPETIMIDRETPKQYTQAMHREIMKNLTRSQRYKYFDIFGND